MLNILAETFRIATRTDRPYLGQSEAAVARAAAAGRRFWRIRRAAR